MPLGFRRLLHLFTLMIGGGYVLVADTQAIVHTLYCVLSSKSLFREFFAHTNLILRKIIL